MSQDFYVQEEMRFQLQFVFLYAEITSLLTMNNAKMETPIQMTGVAHCVSLKLAFRVWVLLLKSALESVEMEW